MSWDSNEGGRVGGDRGMTTVIGVLIAVLVTVVVAVAIGAYVFNATNQPGPDATFDVTQSEVHYDQANWTQANLTTLEISYANGEAIPISRIRLHTNGSRTAWGMDPDSQGFKQWYPIPDVRKTWESDRPVHIEPGQQWVMHAYDGFGFERFKRVHQACEGGLEMRYLSAQEHDVARPYFHEAACSDSVQEEHIELTPLASGDEVTIVWTAESGETTQTLFEYSVQ